MTLLERIEQVGIEAIRNEYDKACDPSLIRSTLEFKTWKQASGLSSIEILARTAGIDPKKLYRITNGDGLPERHADLDLARQRFTDRYGPAGISQAEFHGIKRVTAISAISSKMGLRLPQLGEISLPSLAKLCESVAPPTHADADSDQAFNEWKDRLRNSNSQISENTADVIGTFLIVREFLPGFIDRIVTGAKELATHHSDTIARSMLIELFKIERAWACFKAQKQNWNLIRRNLSTAAQIPDATCAMSSENYIKELVKHWDLTIDDFTLSHSCPGYLLMESKVTRPYALHVLKNHTF